jgi:hypothetical protein
MLEWLETFFSSILGTPGVLGAKSWLEALTWVAVVGAVLCSAISLRHQTLQTRATLLLSLYDHWEDLSQQRWEFERLFDTVKTDVLDDPKINGLQPSHQREALRTRFTEEIKKLVEDKHNKLIPDLVDYLNFFETIGHYVRRRYIPFKVVRSLYKGPILQVDIVFRDAIKEWERYEHVHPGLFGNAVSLMKEMRYREQHPVKYYVVRFRRWMPSAR